MSLEAIIWMKSWVEVLDQTLLPLHTKYIKIDNAEDAWHVINRMQVRGAPAIANVGCLSVAAEVQRNTFTSKQDLYNFVNVKLNYLLTARPTAVNLKIATRDLTEMLQKCFEDDKVDLQDMKERFLNAAADMLRADKAANKMIGSYGVQEILRHVHDDSPINILTHCNTGSLATAGYGTALGVIRALHEKNKINHVYCTETRPCFQGTRLTSYELKTENIPATLICDSMVGALMQKKQITAVVVGADRIVSNGDTANKIGTYQIAVLAKYHDIPFFVAAPRTTIDLSMKTGDDITIEMRSEEEMTCINGTRIAPQDIKCWNPAFDVTPAKLITSIITEQGAFTAAQLVDYFGEH